MHNTPGHCSDAAYFAQVAESYDRLQPVVVGPTYEVGLAMMIDVVPHESDATFEFAELACGTATLTCRLLEQFPNSRGLAFDSEPAMLEIARRKLNSYGERMQVREADLLDLRLPPCDVVLSSFAIHHVPPDRLQGLFQQVEGALRPSGCLMLLDGMMAGPVWGKRIGALSARLRRQHVERAIEAGIATQDEIDARWAFKRKMKAEGRDVEYRHSAELLLQTMSAAGFAEVGLVWRMLAATILIGFTDASSKEADQ